MYLKSLEINGFKSFAKKSILEFNTPVTAIVGPNGSGKSNVVEAMRFVLGEQSMKSMRGRAGADLIFKGSKTLSKMSRASVTITFDNKEKIFKWTHDEEGRGKLDFDEISITREVYSDGGNVYSLNGSEVRLKDIVELMSSVNIGSSGHHIISQGEADRILNASSKDRREMVEDALGLKIYQYRIKESERKLEKTRENMKEVSSLRREIAPHLKFLKGQVEKVKKSEELRADLEGLYGEYLKREEIYLNDEKRNLDAEMSTLETEITGYDAKLQKIGHHRQENAETKESGLRDQLSHAEQKLFGLKQKKDEISRKIGRAEGLIEAKRSILPEVGGVKIMLDEAELSNLKSATEMLLNDAKIADLPSLRRIVEKIEGILTKFFSGKINSAPAKNHEVELEELESSLREMNSLLEISTKEEGELTSEIAHLRKEIDAEGQMHLQSEREFFEISGSRKEAVGALSILSMKKESLKKEEEEFHQEIKEGSVLVGHQILNYKNVVVSMAEKEERQVQEDRRRKIERLKIRLEDAGGGGAEIMKEFEEVSAREEFLARELGDIETSIKHLEELVVDLKGKLDLEFKVGIEKINKEFQEFFRLMFGGGSAFISAISEKKKSRKKKVEDEEYENEEIMENQYTEDGEEALETGVDINVSLPTKKVKDLQMLSGGERSLTSIALLFAISQVNPPPFLVLDETDAALDEANSRKYGDMLENLSKYSELIVVTHNRETMSRAQVLYGVTVGSEGASRLLSVKLAEAVQIAK